MKVTVAMFVCSRQFRLLSFVLFLPPVVAVVFVIHAIPRASRAPQSRQ
jgi:hypothetical protein